MALSHAVLRRLAALAVAVTAAAAPLAAQERGPDLERIAATIDRIETGDSILRRGFEREARGLLTWAAQRDVPIATAHLVARVGFAMGAPFAHPDSAITQREIFWRCGAVRALRAALAADSGDAFAATMLEHLEPYPHIWLEPDRELAHLRALDARRESLPVPLLLALVGMELERGDADRARVVFGRLSPSSIGVARWHHLAAQVGFALDDDKAAAADYYAGAAAITSPRDAAVYRDDLQWIAEPDELENWDTIEPGRHRQWLERFWHRRDLLDGRLPGTRLREHFARWRIALREYRWDREGSHAQGDSPQPARGYEYGSGDDAFPVPDHMALAAANRIFPSSRIIDDRGRLVVRHGPPTHRVQLPGLTGQGQELLAWDVPGAHLVVGFSGPALLPPIAMQPNPRWGLLARNMPVGDLKTGCQLDAKLCSLAGFSGSKVLAERTIERYRAMRDTAESTDGNPERVARDLGAVAQAYGIPGEGVLVVFSAPAAALGTPGDSAILRLRVVIGDSAAGRITTAVETERVWALPTTLDDESRVSGYLLLRNPAGDWRVAVAMSDTLGEAGSGMTADPVPVLAPGDGFALGDPILGRESSGLAWRHLGVRVPLNPTGAWRRDETGTLSLEIHGLTPGRNYRLAVELREAEAREGDAVLSVAGDFSADRAVMMVQREVSFRNLEPGTYRLVVHVTDPVTGQQVRRERLVPIVR